MQLRDIVAALARSYLFEDLLPDDITPLAAKARVQQFARGEYVWRVGDPAHEIAVVVSGEVKVSVLDVDGNEVVYFTHGPGMTFGEPGFFAADHQRVVAVVASAPSLLIRLPREYLAPFIEAHPTIKDRALEGLASNTRWQSTMIATTLRRPLVDRIGLRLLELVDSSSAGRDGARATPKVSQATLAAMVGVSRENVNRALATLAAEGLVRQEKGHYVLLDEPGLRRRLARDWPLAGRRDRRLL